MGIIPIIVFEPVVTTTLQARPDTLSVQTEGSIGHKKWGPPEGAQIA